MGSRGERSAFERSLAGMPWASNRMLHARVPSRPRNIAMTVRIRSIVPLAENPSANMKRLPQREVIRRDVLFAPWKALSAYSLPSTGYQHPPGPSTTLHDPPRLTVRLPAVGRKRRTFPPLLGASAAAWLWRDKSARPRRNEVEAGNLEL